MTLDRRDPEHWETLQARFTEACRQFHEREITIHLFRATLHRLGFRGDEIEREANLHWPAPLPVGQTKVVQIFAGGRR